MPIYVYRCETCKKVHELLQHIDDAPLSVCPDCGGQDVHKLIAPVGVIFKGHGFYKTDNASSKSGSGYHSHSEHSQEASTTSQAAAEPAGSKSGKAAASEASTSSSSTEAPKKESKTESKVA